jgi:hypothetical protein
MGYAILFIFIVLLHPRYCIHINVWVLLHLLCFYSLHTLISLFTSLHFSFFYYPSLLHLFTPLSILSFTSVLLSPFSSSPLYSSLPSLLHLCTPLSLLSFTSVLLSPFSPSPLYSSLPSLLHRCTPLSLLSFTSVLLSPFSPSPLYSSLPSVLYLYSFLSHSWVSFRGIRAERNRLPRPRECCARGESRVCPDTVSNFVPINLYRTWHWVVLLSELCRAESASSLNFSSYLPDDHSLTFNLCRDTRKKSNAASVLCGAEGYLVINPSTGHVFRSVTCLITFHRIPHYCQCSS